MKKLLLLIFFSTFYFTSFSQHDVFVNFYEFLDLRNTVGYRYHITDHTSIGGDVSYKDDEKISNSNISRDGKLFQVTSEYLIYFNPNKGCDKFYVGPKLGMLSIVNDYEYYINNSNGYEVVKYTTEQKDLFVSLTVGSTWRHKSGFFFNANLSLGRSIYTDASTTSNTVRFFPSTKQVLSRLGLNLGWQIGKKENK